MAREESARTLLLRAIRRLGEELPRMLLERLLERPLFVNCREVVRRTRIREEAARLGELHAL